jgi:hypothetical protein
VFEPAVDRLGGAVAGAGLVEVGQDVIGRFLSVRPSRRSSVRAVGTPWARVSMTACRAARPRSGLR